MSNDLPRPVSRSLKLGTKGSWGLSLPSIILNWCSRLYCPVKFETRSDVKLGLRIWWLTSSWLACLFGFTTTNETRNHQRLYSIMKCSIIAFQQIPYTDIICVKSKMVHTLSNRKKSDFIDQKWGGQIQITFTERKKPIKPLSETPWRN